MEQNLYRSTRGGAAPQTASGAIVKGIAEDGGLFVPSRFPVFSLEDLRRFSELSYNGLAAEILSRFLTDFTPEEIRDCVDGAYTAEKFGGPDPAPLKILDERTAVLELWHGPTCAFKDMALQILPRLLTVSAKKSGDGKEIVILTATSGDTGKAALEGFKDVPGTRILVFYPDGGVSEMQKLQMVTQEGENVGVCAVRGNFDDAQTGVKTVFGDREAAEKLARQNFAFSSANSINWGRLVPQIVYYVHAYLQAVRAGALRLGEEADFAVPTGNFGNILAGYYAKKCGLPVGTFVCASNANNVLTDFIRTGVYDRRRDFHATVSPSMDILVSSNLERLLFDLTQNGDEVAGYMKDLAEKGYYRISEETFEKIRALFVGDFCDDEKTLQTIAKVRDRYGYLCDTHTAVAFRAAENRRPSGESERFRIVVSTANPYKFPAAVLSAVEPDYRPADDFDAAERLAAVTGEPMPAPLAGLKGKKPRFTRICDKTELLDAVYDLLGL